MKNLAVITIVFLLLVSCKEYSKVISLEGSWQFALDSTDVGISQGWYNKDFNDKIALPGTTDEAGKGVPNLLTPSIGKPQVLHLTRKNRYVGPAWYSKEINIPSAWKDKQIRLFLERVIWSTTVWVDGIEIPEKGESLIAPHSFNLTEYLTPGKHLLAIRVDNRKKYDISVEDMAHAYTDHTQIMWNGILGEIKLLAEESVSIDNIQVYPDISGKQIRVKASVNNTSGPRQVLFKAKATLAKTNASLKEIEIKGVTVDSGEQVVEFVYPMGDSVLLWNEFNPNLYNLSVSMHAGEVVSAKNTTFGMREIKQQQSAFYINNTPAYLRGTLECCIFPLTGRPPMDKEGWRKVFVTAREWGLNHLRFHSWCPPAAAFDVADELGFYLQVELPVWSLTVGSDKQMNKFMYDEADRILKEYGNHPSFCLFSLGNELQPDFVFLNALLDYTKKKDSRHLYTNSSMTFEKGHGDWPEKNDDFLITQSTKKGWVRGQGTFDVESPSFDKDYSPSVEGMGVPLITHEMGQYAVYPNMNEIPKYTGVLDPLNFKGVKQELEKKNLLSKANDYMMASGKLAALLYKEEIERAMKTSGNSGFQLLDLHDFPGQGTALVGLLDAFWDNKGIIEASDFRKFCAPVVPLARFKKAVYTNNELFEASVDVANFGNSALNNQTISWSLKDAKGKLIGEGSVACNSLLVGKNRQVGNIRCDLSQLTKAEKVVFTLSIDNTTYQNDWNIWVYPTHLSTENTEIVVTRNFNEAVSSLAKGCKVLYNPAFNSVKGLEGKFLSVFWSPVHFQNQAGSMGLLCNPDHPAFANFPTDMHTNWQWWSLLKQSKTMVLDSIGTVVPLVEVVDNFVANRRLSNMFEAKLGEGKLIFCSMDLLSDWDKRPEARQLYYSLLEYMKSEDFNPSYNVTEAEISSLLIAK